VLVIKIESGDVVAIKVGNTLALGNIPLGSIIHNIELQPKGGAILARSAGSAVQLVAKRR
jgi:large subunit ribosomal protein L2